MRCQFFCAFIQRSWRIRNWTILCLQLKSWRAFQRQSHMENLTKEQNARSMINSPPRPLPPPQKKNNRAPVQQDGMKLEVLENFVTTYIINAKISFKSSFTTSRHVLDVYYCILNQEQLTRVENITNDLTDDWVGAVFSWVFKSYKANSLVFTTVWGWLSSLK